MITQNHEEKYTHKLPDGGPHYTETDLSQFIVEPWNAFSSLLYLIPVIYFLILLRGEYKNNKILLVSMPFLAIGGIGSTLFHAFRQSKYLLYMDFVPIIILGIIISVFFWYKILGHKVLVACIIILSFLLRMAVMNIFSGHLAININYFISGCMMFVPALIILLKTRYRAVQHLLASISLFIISLYFRAADANPHLPFEFGVHWLWHLFSAAGALFLAFYIYYINKIELKPLTFTSIIPRL